MAIVDASYRFIHIGVGAYGRNSDGGIFSNCNFGKALRKEKLNIPNAEVMPENPDTGALPYVFVGDEAFPLMYNLMRPYPVGKSKDVTEGELIFNYRLSRARRIVENAFGILSSRWRVFHTRIMLEAENVNKVIMAACVLHNFLQSSSTPAQISSLCTEGNSANENADWQPLIRTGNRGSDEAIEVRQRFQNFFVSPAGEVPWQYDMVRKGKF